MIDVFDRNARIARKLMDRVADGVDAELEHAAAIHGQHARAICGSLKRRGTDQTGNAQRLDVGRRRKLNGKGVVSPSFNHCGACPIAKKHAGGTVGPVERARHLLGSNNKHALGTAAGDIALGDIERKYEAGTSRRDIEGRARRAQALSNGTRLSGNKVVTRRRRADDQIQLARVDSGHLECPLARRYGKVVK